MSYLLSSSFPSPYPLPSYLFLVIPHTSCHTVYSTNTTLLDADSTTQYSTKIPSNCLQLASVHLVSPPVLYFHGLFSPPRPGGRPDRLRPCPARLSLLLPRWEVHLETDDARHYTRWLGSSVWCASRCYQNAFPFFLLPLSPFQSRKRTRCESECNTEYWITASLFGDRSERIPCLVLKSRVRLSPAISAC